MSESIVIVLEYDSEFPLIEAIMKIIQHAHHLDLPDAKLIQTHLAIREDADRIIAVINKDKPKPDSEIGNGLAQGKWVGSGSVQGIPHDSPGHMSEAEAKKLAAAKARIEHVMKGMD